VLFNITDGSKEKWNPERMKAAIEAMRNKEMDSYMFSRLSTHPKHQ
jgi:hypothetical protein